jgi:hypothetical protein
MKNNSPQKLEIFLWLALRQHSAHCEDLSEAPPVPADESGETKDASNVSPETSMPALFSQLTKAETDKLKSLLADYDAQSFPEREIWKKQVKSGIGADADTLDRNIHWSHIEKYLTKESPVIRRIIFDSLREAEKERLKSSLEIQESEKQELSNRHKSKLPLVEKAVRKAFAKQFTHLSDLSKPTAFDRLTGTQMARLIRLAGIREVAFACARIEAVETIAAFLKRFSAEDARAIAAQLNNLPKTSNERLLFAENLVQTALEIESNPSAMLDLLGIRLIGITICESAANRIAYAKQKLPLDFAPELSEIIDTQCRQTAPDLQKKIALEIEQIAAKLRETK